MKIGSVLLSLVILLAGCDFRSIKHININDRTVCEGISDLEIIEYDIEFIEGIKNLHGAGRMPMIYVEMTFKNKSSRPIKRAVFEIIPFCKIANQETNTDIPKVSFPSYTYPKEVSPNEQGKFIYENGVYDLTLPLKLIIRVSRIEYTDGTSWKRDGTN
jgi:hypothetical protein